MTTKYITLDAWRDNYVHVHAVKGETAARFLAVTLTGNGAAINLSDKTVAIYYKKPDGTTIFNSGTIKTATAGLVEIPLTAQMSVVAGEMQDVEIRVTGTGGGTLKIKGLQITIDPAESYDSAVASTDEYTALETALGSVTGFASHMASKANPHAVTAAQAGARPNTWVPSAADLLNVIYPVGSIYLSVAAASPAALFGGTWERIKDKFLLSAGDTYAAGATGGEASHTLSEDELPVLSGNITMHGSTIGTNISGASGVFSPLVPIGDFGYFGNTNSDANSYSTVGFSAGSGAAHNNMPPYLAVYIWKRTA